MRPHAVRAGALVVLLSLVGGAAALGNGSPHAPPGHHALYFAADAAPCVRTRAPRLIRCDGIYRVDAGRLARHRGVSLLLSAGQRIALVPNRVAALAFAASDPSRRTLLYLTYEQRDPQSADSPLDLWAVGIDGSDPRLLRADAMSARDLTYPWARQPTFPGGAPSGVQLIGADAPVVTVSSPDGALSAYLPIAIDTTVICAAPRSVAFADASRAGSCVREGSYDVPVWAPN